MLGLDRVGLSFLGKEGLISLIYNRLTGLGVFK